MFCLQCGCENPNDVKFCFNCGFGIAAQSESVQAPSASPPPLPPENVQAPSASPPPLPPESVQAPSASPPPLPQTNSLTLKSIVPNTINLQGVMMYKVKHMALAMRLDGTWGDVEFQYSNYNDLHDDYSKLFEALQRITNNNVMWFNARERPAVVLNRITNVHLNDWWKRIELDIAGVGQYWVMYDNQAPMNTDYSTLMYMLANRG